jgi:crotonobetainyl-CoA:carnitine CoA-transferase CaiB-like acyl-CoA transferase
VARGLAIHPARPDGSTVPGVRTPIRFSDAALALDRAAPMLGEDTPRR